MNSTTENVETTELTDTLRSDCEDPPFFSTCGSTVSTLNPNAVTGRNLNKTLENLKHRPPPSYLARRTELIRMDEVVERLWDPDGRQTYTNGRHLQNLYRPSILRDSESGNLGFTATWGGELRVRNEALVDENMYAKEQTLRDLEKLNAIGKKAAEDGQRTDQVRCGSSFLASCSADMRGYMMNDNDSRLPSFLKNRDPMPLKRMQVPGMMVERESSILSSHDDNGFGFIGMDFSCVREMSGSPHTGPPSLCSSSDFTLSEKGRSQSSKASLFSKCVRGVSSWKKLQKHFIGKDIPVIKEEQNGTTSSDSNSVSGTSIASKANCFLCLGGTQATKYSVDEPVRTVDSVMESREERTPGDLKSILLTTSPLYGDLVPPNSACNKDPIDDLAFSTQQSLNIAATHNPTNDLSSDDENEDVIAMWDESDAEDSDDGHGYPPPLPPKRGGSPMDCPSARSWEPPALKTDQEYEMYQLESRMDSVHSAKHQLEGCLSTASSSSWDLTTAKDFTRINNHNRARRTASQASSNSDFGMESQLAHQKSSLSSRSGNSRQPMTSTLL